MNPNQRENMRYAEKDFCEINREEEIMFSLLDRYTKYQKFSPINLRVLDLGCGSGHIGKNMLNKGYQVFGLDFSEEAVKKAQAQGISVKQANLDEGIPEPDDTFNVVWAGDIIEHVFDPIGLLKEIQRVLKKDGALILSIPSDVGIISRIKMLFGQSYQEQMYRRSGYYKHHTFFNLQLITFMLAEAGLQLATKEKILIAPNKKRYSVNFLPSAFYNELVILARKV